MSGRRICPVCATFELLPCERGTQPGQGLCRQCRRSRASLIALGRAIASELAREVAGYSDAQGDFGEPVRALALLGHPAGRAAVAHQEAHK